MNLITLILFVACVVTTLDLPAYAVANYWSQFDSFEKGTYRSISARNRCPSLSGKLKNGWARSVEEITYFKCFQTYTLIGSTSLSCHHSGWSGPTPVCGAPGCSSLKRPANGQITFLKNRIYAKFKCDPGYIMTNLSKEYTYCDGKYWNSTEPGCIANPSTKSLVCNFEKYDLCGWTVSNPDQAQRSNPFLTMHSTGNRSHFLYLYNDPLTDKPLILYSPVFESRHSGTCFVFWYRVMTNEYFIGSNSFKIYIKPESMSLKQLVPWEIKLNESSANNWVKAHLFIPHLDTPFQIVMDLSNAARVTNLDDTGIYDREKCVDNSLNNTKAYNNWISCRDRCSEASPSFSFCSCHDNCESEDSCCPDYNLYCHIKPYYEKEFPTKTTTEYSLDMKTTETKGNETSSSTHPTSLANHTLLSLIYGKKSATNITSGQFGSNVKQSGSQNASKQNSTPKGNYKANTTPSRLLPSCCPDPSAWQINPCCNTKPSSISILGTLKNASLNEDRKENEIEKKEKTEATPIERKNEALSQQLHSLDISTSKVINFDNTKDNNLTTGSKLSQKLPISEQKSSSKSGILWSMLIILITLGLVFVFLKRRNRMSSLLYQDSELKYLTQDDEQE